MVTGSLSTKYVAYKLYLKAGTLVLTFLNSGIGITFISMCQMAPSISFQWAISNFNAPFENFNEPRKRLIISIWFFFAEA